MGPRSTSEQPPTGDRGRKEPTHDIRAYGAVAEAEAATTRTIENTRAIQAAIDACGTAGGGTVVVPAGCFVTGSIVLRSRVELHLAAGATLAGAAGAEHYPVIESRYGGYVGFNAWSLFESGSGGVSTGVGGRGDDTRNADRRACGNPETAGDCYGGAPPFSREAHRPLIFADGESDVTVCGPGTIDGRGEPWWEMRRSERLERARPTLIGMNRCRGVTIRDVRLVNSPAWTVHPTFCTDVHIRGVRITNPPDSPNTDGIDPDSCSGVIISDCSIDVGDDCVCIKSGNEVDGRELGVPCENVLVSNCLMSHGHGGVVIGSEIAGGARAILVSNCVFDGTDRGIRIKSRRRRGGWARDVSFSNIHMRNVLCPLVINAYYHCGSNPEDEFIHGEAAQPVDQTTPRFSDIRLSSITCRGASVSAGFVYGLPEMPVQRLSIRDVDVEVRRQSQWPARQPAMALRAAPSSAEGFWCRFACDVRISESIVRGAVGEAWRFERCTGVEGAKLA